MGCVNSDSYDSYDSPENIACKNSINKLVESPLNNRGKEGKHHILYLRFLLKYKKEHPVVNRTSLELINDAMSSWHKKENEFFLHEAKQKIAEYYPNIWTNPLVINKNPPNSKAKKNRVYPLPLLECDDEKVNVICTALIYGLTQLDNISNSETVRKKTVLLRIIREISDITKLCQKTASNFNTQNVFKKLRLTLVNTTINTIKDKHRKKEYLSPSIQKSIKSVQNTLVPSNPSVIKSLTSPDESLYPSVLKTLTFLDVSLNPNVQRYDVGGTLNKYPQISTLLKNKKLNDKQKNEYIHKLLIATLKKKATYEIKVCNEHIKTCKSQFKNILKVSKKKDTIKIERNYIKIISNLKLKIEKLKKQNKKI